MRYAARFSALTAIFVIAAAMPALAASAIPVIGCTTISTPGFYEVTVPINAVGTCIVINTSGVTLEVANDITGNGDGIGIQLTSDTEGDVVRGPIGEFGEHATISNFNVGIESDGSGEVIGDFDLDDNLDTGLLINGPNAGTSCDHINANNNTNYGVHFLSSNGARGFDIGGHNNGIYAVWLDFSTHVILSGIGGSSNGTADAQLGGPSAYSKSNVIDYADVSGSKYGLVIEKGSRSNVIGNAGLLSNGETAATIDDLLDKNEACDHDIWFVSSYKKRSPSCIH